MSDYDYAKHYRNVKKAIDSKYGTVHLCGNCVHMTRCVRNEIQYLNNINYKKALMAIKAPFVKHYVVEPLITHHKDRGFVAVYDCERFEFEGYEGDE